MKKVISVFLIIFVLLGFSGCINTYNKAFSDNKAQFTEIADFALSYYENSQITEKDHLTMAFSGNELILYAPEKDVKIDHNLDNSLNAVEKLGFEFMWVSSDYVIFWKDETKYYGLIYSKSAQKHIREIKKEWYDGMKHHKLDSDWYEIGVL